MNKLLFSLFVLLIFSCSTPSEPVKVTVQDRINEVAQVYVRNTLADLQKDMEQKSTIDSIEVAKIDTLTDKAILVLKILNKVAEWESQNKINEAENKLVSLNMELGVYENKALRDIAMKELNEQKEQSDKLNEEIDQMKLELDSGPDSVTFRYYLVTTIITATDPNLVQHSVDLPFVATKDFKVKEFEDL